MAGSCGYSTAARLRDAMSAEVANPPRRARRRQKQLTTEAQRHRGKHRERQREQSKTSHLLLFPCSSSYPLFLHSLCVLLCASVVSLLPLVPSVVRFPAFPNRHSRRSRPLPA